MAPIAVLLCSLALVLFGPAALSHPQPITKATPAEAVTSPPTSSKRTRRGCRTRKCAIRVARKRCSQSRPRSCIRRAALHHRVSYSMLVRKAWCESTMNPRARNGVHVGLFQFRYIEGARKGNSNSTWHTTPYWSRDPIWAKWNALAAAWMHRSDVGRGGEWTCR